MQAITLRNIPADLARLIERKAREMHTSLNRAVLYLLEQGTGSRRANSAPRHHDLDALAGTWSRREAQEFDSALLRQRAVEPELWK